MDRDHSKIMIPPPYFCRDFMCTGIAEPAGSREIYRGSDGEAAAAALWSCCGSTLELRPYHLCRINDDATRFISPGGAEGWAVLFKSTQYVAAAKIFYAF